MDSLGKLLPHKLHQVSKLFDQETAPIDGKFCKVVERGCPNIPRTKGEM